MAAGANIGDAGVTGGQGKYVGNGHQTRKRKRANALSLSPHGLGVVGSANAHGFGVALAPHARLVRLGICYEVSRLAMLIIDKVLREKVGVTQVTPTYDIGSTYKAALAYLH